MLVAEEKMCPLALDDERIERRQDVHQFGRFAWALQRLGPRPMLLLAGALPV
jgi:hypothetical protein